MSYHINEKQQRKLVLTHLKLPRIIAFTGEAFAGKTTAAKIFCDTYYNAEILSFAKPIKDMLKTLGLKNYDVYGDGKDCENAILGGKTPRHAMETLGTEWRNMIDRDLWVNIWANRATACLTMKVAHIVCDYLRYEHEASFILNEGGVIIKLIREGVKLNSQHPSTKPLPNNLCDVIIHNNTNNKKELISDIKNSLVDIVRFNHVRRKT